MVWDQDTARIIIGALVGIALALIVHKTMPKSTWQQRYVIVLIACVILASAFAVQDAWAAWQAQ